MSTQEQAKDDHYSLVYQRARIDDYCAAQGWELVDVFSYVRSGGSNQKELEQILARVKQDRIQAVVVMELDRLARDMVSTLLFLEDLHAAGARFVSVADNLDLTTPEGELQMHILATFAMFFRRQLSRKVKAGKLERAKAGKRDGERPYGYQPSGDTWAIDPVEAPIVQQVYQWYLHEDLGFRAIAKRLNAQGVPGQKGRVGTWDARTIERMLRREAYVGDLVHGKWIWHRGRDGQSHLERGPQPLVVPDTHPAIIDRAMWDAVQARLAVKAQLGPRGQQTPYLLSGLVRCGACGAAMVAVQRGPRRKDGTRPPVYICRAYHVKGQCSTATRIPVATLEQTVGYLLRRELRAVKRRVTGAHVRRWLAQDAAVQVAAATATRLRQRQREIPAMLARAEEAMLQGVYTPDQFRQVRERLEAEAAHITAELAEAHSAVSVDPGVLIARLQRLVDWYHAAIQGDAAAHDQVRPALQEVITTITCHPEGRVAIDYRDTQDA